MILLKSFFRKISTKLYLVIFSLLLVSINILLGFANYYTDLLDKEFENSSCILMISKNEHYDKINKYKNVSKIEKFLLFKPDYSYNILGREGYEVWQNGDLVDSRESEVESRLNWETFLNPYIKYISVFSDSSLTENQISFGFTPIINYERPIESVISEKIGFNVNNQKQEFIINDLYKSYFPEMIISEEKFNELYLDSQLYGYRITVNSYSKANRIMNKLETLEKNSDFKITLKDIDYSYFNKSNKPTMQSLKDTVKTLSIAIFFAIFTFSVIFISVIKNVINDESKSVNTDRLLGFNQKQIRKYLLLKISILNIITFLNTIIISLIIKNYVKKVV